MPSLSSATLADLLQAIGIRVLGWLVHRGAVEDRAELTLIDDEFAERSQVALVGRASSTARADRNASIRARRLAALTDASLSLLVLGAADEEEARHRRGPVRCMRRTQEATGARDPPQSIERFLRHMGESTQPPALSPARDPPCFQSRAVRRTLAELAGVGRPSQQGQLQMFDLPAARQDAPAALDFYVHAEFFMNPTAELADLVLPALGSAP